MSHCLVSDEMDWLSDGKTVVGMVPWEIVRDLGMKLLLEIAQKTHLDSIVERC